MPRRQAWMTDDDPETVRRIGELYEEFVRPPGVEAFIMAKLEAEGMKAPDGKPYDSGRVVRALIRHWREEEARDEAR